MNACERFGLSASELFDTIDLYQEKNINLVINNIHALAKTAKNRPGYNLPIMEEEDRSKTVSLFVQSLNENNVLETTAPSNLIIDENEVELVKWMNSHMIKRDVSLLIGNLTYDLRSGARLLQLLEILTRSPVGVYEPEPQNYWQAMQNATLVISFLTSQTCQRYEECTPRGKNRYT